MHSSLFNWISSSWVPLVFEHRSKNTFYLDQQFDPYGFDIRSVSCKRSVYWMFCTYLVLVAVASFLETSVCHY